MSQSTLGGPGDFLGDKDHQHLVHIHLCFQISVSNFPDEVENGKAHRTEEIYKMLLLFDTNNKGY